MAKRGNPNITKVSKATQVKKGSKGLPGAGRKPTILNAIKNNLKAEGLEIPGRQEMTQMILLLMQCTEDRLEAISIDESQSQYLRVTAKYILDCSSNFQIFQFFTRMAIAAPIQSAAQKYSPLEIVIVDSRKPNKSKI